MPVGGILLVVTERLPLIDQTIAAYKHFSPARALSEHMLTVASKRADETVERAGGANCYEAPDGSDWDDVERGVLDIASFLQRSDSDDGAPRIIFSTYQSLRKVAEAQKLVPEARIDLGVFDEAHRMAGASPSLRLGLLESKLALRRFARTCRLLQPPPARMMPSRSPPSAPALKLI